MYISIIGEHRAELLIEANLPIVDDKYIKFGKDFFNEEDVNDSVFDYFKYYLNDFKNFSYSFIQWYKKNDESAWFDLRIDNEGKLYAAAGDNEGIKFLDPINDYITIDYCGFEINIEPCYKYKYVFNFSIDPDGGILRSSDEERGFFFYDDLNSASETYPMVDYSLKSALDDLVAHSDDYQNHIEDDDEDDEEEE